MNLIKQPQRVRRRNTVVRQLTLLPSKTFAFASKDFKSSLKFKRSAQATGTFESEGSGNSVITNSVTNSVTFSQVQIRKYDLIIGDTEQTCHSEGLPLSLGWEYEEGTAVSIDEYEGEKTLKWQGREQPLSPKERRDLLQRIGGYSERELFRAERTILIQRRTEFFGAMVAANADES